MKNDNNTSPSVPSMVETGAYAEIAGGYVYGGYNEDKGYSLAVGLHASAGVSGYGQWGFTAKVGWTDVGPVSLPSSLSIAKATSYGFGIGTLPGTPLSLAGYVNIDGSVTAVTGVGATDLIEVGIQTSTRAPAHLSPPPVGVHVSAADMDLTFDELQELAGGNSSGIAEAKRELAADQNAAADIGAAAAQAAFRSAEVYGQGPDLTWGDLGRGIPDVLPGSVDPFDSNNPPTATPPDPMTPNGGLGDDRGPAPGTPGPGKPGELGTPVGDEGPPSYDDSPPDPGQPGYGPGDPYGGEPSDPYGGDPYGGDPYGGAPPDDNTGGLEDPGGWAGGDGPVDNGGEYAPVLLDLTGDGLKVTPLSSSTTYLDSEGNGYQHRTAWAGVGNGVLVLDASHDGKIHDKDQYAFTQWDPTATGDLQALKDVFDTNHDGKLDAGDARWADFKVMVNGQMVTLASLGIQSIDLTATGSGQTVSDFNADGSLRDSTVTTTNTSTRTVTIEVDGDGALDQTKTTVISPAGNTTVTTQDLNPDGRPHPHHQDRQRRRRHLRPDRSGASSSTWRRAPKRLPQLRPGCRRVPDVAERGSRSSPDKNAAGNNEAQLSPHFRHDRRMKQYGTQSSESRVRHSSTRNATPVAV